MQVQNYDGYLAHRFILASILATGCMCVTSVLAAPDEIQVYTDDINAPGKFGVEQHVNYVIKGRQTPDYPGQMPTHHVTQINPEFSYGINNNLEGALYVPVAVSSNGDTFLNGLRLTLKYIAPKLPEDPVFYGVGVELGRISIRTSESRSTFEFRPIIGYRDAKWLMSFNPIFNMGLDDNVSHKPQFEPALKLTHSVGEDMHAGFEYYGEYGALNALLPSDQRSHTLYAVLDVEQHDFDINLGIGRGYVNAVDEWVVKAVIALPFN